MKRWRLAAPVLALALVAAACGSDEPDSPGSSTDSTAGGAQTVTIALGGPFSGGSKATGDNIRAGAELAADEINAGGGIDGGPLKGARIEFKEFDDAGVPANGASNMRTIIDDKDLVAFVGSGLSDVSVAMAPTASREAFPFLSAYASSEKILEAAQDAKTVFVVPPTFPAYAYSVTDELLKAGHTKPGILHATGTYGDGIANLTVERLKEKGVTPVANESFTFADTDFRVQLAKIKDAEPDSLVVVGLATIDALILTQADELGLTVPFFDPGGITNNQTFLDAAGPLAEGVVGNTPTLASRSTPATLSLRDKYMAATGQSVIPDSAVFSYEGVRAVAAAFAAGAGGRDDLAEYLHKISIADTGVGSLQFSEDGSRIGGQLYVFRITGGQPEFFIGYEQTGPKAVKEVPITG
ncbi:MAG: branched-chain amino acid transport system substrate-binding protein [Actinomycetota bacterium]|nr:branched-chain amino acid transport system substrate-binding protein [Actinomycetota bacterium]